ncbi:MAG: hypothetical protein C0501_07910 [Isosphaera sp.]|nr:hypothetical protein [Isosphaera sp.]
MNPDPKPPLADLYPLPDGVKIRTRKFGASPGTPLKDLPPDGPQADSGPPRREFVLSGEYKDLGITVRVQEVPGSGRLVADVFSTDPTHLNTAAVSVALVGTDEDRMIRKTIPLDVPEQAGGYRCSGSADFGPLPDVRAELGTKLGLVVFLVV